MSGNSKGKEISRRYDASYDIASILTESIMEVAGNDVGERLLRFIECVSGRDVGELALTKPKDLVSIIELALGTYSEDFIRELTISIKNKVNCPSLRYDGDLAEFLTSLIACLDKDKDKVRRSIDEILEVIKKNKSSAG